MRKLNNLLVSIFLTFILVGSAFPASTASTASGNWNNAAIWSNGIPGNNDIVTITAGHTVTLNVNTATIRSLTIQAGAVFRGDGTGKQLFYGNGVGEDFTNDGSLLGRDAQAFTIVLNKNSVWGGTGTFQLGVLDLNTKTLSFNVGSSFTVNLNASPDPILNPGKINSAQDVVFKFDGTLPQNLPNDTNVHYRNLVIANPAGVTLKTSLTTTNLNGSLTLTPGSLLTTLDGTSAFVISGNAANSITLGANSTLRLGTTATTPSTFPVGFVTYNFDETSTVDYVNNSATTQIINTNPVYGNIQLHGTGPKTLPSGTLSLKGNWTNDASGAWSVTSPNTVVFDAAASSAKSVGGSVSTSFNNLTINNSSGVSLDTGITVTGVLALGSHKVSTGADILALGPAGSVSRTTGYVNGNLQKQPPVGAANLTFEVGDASTYAPVDVAFQNVTFSGGVIVSTTAGEHSQIGTSYLDPSKDANRYWTMTGAGIGFSSSYDITLHFVSGDVDGGANTSNFVVNKYNIPTWYTESTGTRTATSTQALGLTTFCDFAVGESQSFVITATAGANGTLTPNGSVVVNYGSNQGFTVTANTGYHIDSVLVDGADVGPVGAYTFTNVTANHTIRTVYAIDQFTITATTGPNGSITPSGSVVADYGSDHGFTITPNLGYHVDSVLVDGVDQGPVGAYTFSNVTANHTIRTVYAINQFTITSTAGSNGIITPNGSVAVNYGSNQGFTVTPNVGYHVDSVVVDGADVGPVGAYTFTNVTANHTIRTVYAIDQFTITTTTGPNGSISPSGSVVADYGSDHGFTITPNLGYHVDSVLVDGVDVGPVGAYTFANVTANHTIRTVYALDQFTITATAGSNGSLTPNGSVVANYGSDQGFTVTPNTGYHVDSVLVDGLDVGPVGAYSFTNVTANHTIRTVYAINQFTITATTGPNGSITPAGSAVVDYGSDQSFTITPNTGYYVADVQVDSVSVGQVASYSFTNVTANHAIHATFALSQYAITSSAGSNGSISPNGSVVVDYGSDQSYTITPTTGYYVADVQVDSVSVGQLTNYTFTNVTANHTIHATFAITQFTIASTAGANGSVAPGGSVVVDYGSDQGFTVTPNAGYYVADVQVDSVSVGQVTSYTFTNVTANHTIHATFAITQYTITASAGANGSIAPSGALLVDHGASQGFSITANSGYYISDVQVDSVSVGEVTSYTFSNVTANHSIHATFALSQYTITASAGANGNIAPGGAVPVSHGGSRDFTITPNTGYYVSDVQVDSVSVGQLTSYTFTNVTANHTIHADFALSQYTITAVAGTNGTITPAGSTVVNYGDSLAYTIAPGAGYYVVDVQVDTVSVGAVTQYTFTNISANHLISAIFAEMNLAPTAAQLLSPANGDTLVIENLGSAVGFAWSASFDANVADAVTYSIHLSGPGIDSVLSGLSDTTLQWGITSMLQSGGSYWWTVNATDGQVVTASPDTFTFHVTSMVAVADAGKDLPKTYALFQNFPNPFNPTTVVRFDLPRVSSVRISVYNLIGQEVAVLIDGKTMGAGHQEVSMNAGGLSSGVYLYRITAKAESGDVFSSVKKMVLVK